MPQTKFQFDTQMQEVLKKLTADILWAIGKPSRLDEVKKAELIATAVPSLLQALQDSGYQGAYEQELRDASETLKAYHKISGIPLAFSTIEKRTLTALKEMDLNKFNSLGHDAILELYAQVKTLVIGGASDADYLAAVTKVIDEGLGRYAVTYANTSRAIFTQTAEDLVANQYRENGEPVYWEYVGPADNKNRDECVWALNKATFTDQQRTDFENKYGTRYNCRHTFMMITKEAFDQGEVSFQDTNDKEKARRQAVLDLFAQ